MWFCSVDDEQEVIDDGSKRGLVHEDDHDSWNCPASPNPLSEKGWNRGPVMGYQHTFVGYGSAQDEIVVGTCQTELLDRDDIQIRTLTTNAPKDVMAGVLVPEQANHFPRLARSRAWSRLTGVWRSRSSVVVR